MRARIPHRGPLPIVVVLTLAGALAAPPAALAGTDLDPAARTEPRWISRIDHLVAGHPVSVTVGIDGRYRYRHKAAVRRIPASNEKLLLSMALLDRLGPRFTIPTLVQAESAPDGNGVIDGAVWILGRGDPEVGHATIRDLARQIRAAGITKVRGRVRGSTGYFSRDWWAPGWKSNFPAKEVARPTALTYLGNVGGGGTHISDPEHRAAAALTKRLRRVGIRVTGVAGAGEPPGGLTPLAQADSAALKLIVRRMDLNSLNFTAEVLGKLLARVTAGLPATIASGARAIATFEHRQGVDGFEHHDSSGLSSANRVRAQGIVRLLWAADAHTWGSALRRALPAGGQGTLAHRLRDVRVRAKTGTLDRVSALSGWVWLERRDAWGEFSILSRGLDKTDAIRIEDAIVHTVAANAG
ncbi:MAG: D-alanyl-D-alanine carboxypeptidase [Actinobacteria bacterium]|nr:D-alanyl-D-alanine carboxypeptidase [Actinomycetota bacterium]